MTKKSKIKLKEKVNSAVAGTLASSILISSCTYYDAEPLIFDEFVPTSDIGQNALPIKIAFNRNDASYVNAIKKISIDVIQSPEVAKQFASNPQELFAKYGYDGPIQMDSEILKFIEALGDDEINQALENRDIGRFLVLCEKRGLLHNASKDTILLKYKEQIKYILNKDGQTRAGRPPGITYSNVDISINLVVPIGAIAVAVVLAAIIAGIETAINVHAIAHTRTSFVSSNSVTQNPSIGEGGEIITPPILDTLTIMNIASLKTDDSYQMFEDYYGSIADELITYIETIKPDIYKEFSREELRQWIIANIVISIQQ